MSSNPLFLEPRFGLNEQDEETLEDRVEHILRGMYDDNKSVSH